MNTSISQKNGTIVVGVDGSPASAKALKWASNYAEHVGHNLKIVTTWDAEYVAVAIAAFGGDAPSDDSIESRHALAASLQTKSIADVFGDTQLPSWVSLELIEGRASDALVRASDGAELLVVGTRGHGHIADMVLGSVSTYCVLHAHCPVTVIRADSVL